MACSSCSSSDITSSTQPAIKRKAWEASLWEFRRQDVFSEKKKKNKWGIGGTLQDPSEENATPCCLLPLIYI